MKLSSKTSNMKIICEDIFRWNTLPKPKNKIQNTKRKTQNKQNLTDKITQYKHEQQTKQHNNNKHNKQHTNNIYQTTQKDKKNQTINKTSNMKVICESWSYLPKPKTWK